MEHFEIRRGIKIPKIRAGRLRGGHNSVERVSYPFSEMGIGDCFSYPYDFANRVISAASAHSAKYGNFAFVTRKMPNNIGMLWRISNENNK